MPDATFHIAREGQVGAFEQEASLDDALLEAYSVMAAEGIPVSVLRADGDLAEGARVSWTELCVVSPPEAS